jgi:hypothetical protein
VKSPLDVPTNYLLLFTCGAGEEQHPLLLRPFIGLLYQHWMIDGDYCGTINGMNEWQGTPKYLGENLPQCSSVYHRPYMNLPGLKPRSPWWEAGVQLPRLRQDPLLTNPFQQYISSSTE